MPIDRQKQLLQEICSEYDLPTVIEALCQIHDTQEILDLVKTRQQLTEPIDSWEMQSCVALADEIIEVCQKSQN